VFASISRYNSPARIAPSFYASARTWSFHAFVLLAYLVYYLVILIVTSLVREVNEAFYGNLQAEVVMAARRDAHVRCAVFMPCAVSRAVQGGRPQSWKFSLLTKSPVDIIKVCIMQNTIQSQKKKKSEKTLVSVIFIFENARSSFLTYSDFPRVSDVMTHAVSSNVMLRAVRLHRGWYVNREFVIKVKTLQLCELFASFSKSVCNRVIVSRLASKRSV
jgi:hypothetical protein